MTALSSTPAPRGGAPAAYWRVLRVPSDARPGFGPEPGDVALLDERGVALLESEGYVLDRAFQTSRRAMVRPA